MIPRSTEARTGVLPDRLMSMDAYRGFVMTLMAAELLQFQAVHEALPGSTIWAFLARQQSHVEWVGCTLHDLIQPSFSFLVGVALPYSVASRTNRGESFRSQLGHTLRRSLILILLGVFLRSIHHEQTYFTFEDTLSQIGLGYPFLFLLGRTSVRQTWVAFGAILVGYWLAFVLYPAPGTAFDYTAVGVPPDWPEHFTGLMAHFNKNSNLAWAFDTWFLNLFPREKPFLFNGGGYATLSFIPTLATMVLGLQVGRWLRQKWPANRLLRQLIVMGLIGIVAGVMLQVLGICPVVKRIWTPAWVLFSGGWCCWLLAGFYALIDLWGFRLKPLLVVGMNSIAIYCLVHLIDRFIIDSFHIHIGRAPFQVLGAAYEPLLTGALTLAVFYLILRWMYNRRLFIRI
ncbi:putative acyltransferase [Spirosoma oryzae]|uniref:Putative acyltransferase n=1 Tax=Spirosoma oryzae TaxID=1469603 RepID=A0A2T0SY52_9BACT|nr:putative acyltransferase [Spirosoma oryzae]